MCVSSSTFIFLAVKKIPWCCPKCHPWVAWAVVIVIFLFSHYHSDDIKRFFGFNNSSAAHTTRAPIENDLQIASGASKAAGATDNALQSSGQFIILNIFCFVVGIFIILFIKWLFKLNIFRRSIDFVKRSLPPGLINRGRSESFKASE